MFINDLIFFILGPTLPVGLRWTAQQLLAKRSRGKFRTEGIFNVYEACYDTKKKLCLDVYPVKGKGESMGSTLLPVVLFIHGGAWMSGKPFFCASYQSCFQVIVYPCWIGEKSLYAPISNSFKMNGYVLVVPNYSLYPKASLIDMLDDIANAIEWTQANIRLTFIL